MSSYIPPKKGTDASPQTGLPNPLRVSGGPDAASDGGREVERKFSPVIQAWVNAQRQNAACSPTELTIAKLSHPSFTATFWSLQGSERVTVFPKPGASLPVEPDKTEEEPEPVKNKLPELVGDEHDDTPKCLMVLYSKLNDQKGTTDWCVAAIRMSSLGKSGSGPSVEYQGVSKKSQWVDKPGCLLTTMQAQFGKQSWVMLPLDFTGEKAANNLYLSTTELGDATKTDGDPTAMPLVAGSGSSVYTTGGSFILQQKNILKTHSLYKEANGLRQVPHAIGSDGTCYYVPLLQGDISLGVSSTTNPVMDIRNSRELSDQLDKKMTDVPLSEVTVHDAVVIDKIISKTVHVDAAVQDDTLDVDGTVAYYGVPIKLKASISAYSFYCASAYGVGATVTNFAAAQGTTSALDYSGGEFGFSITQARGVVNIIDNKVPLMNYDGGGKAAGDLLPVVMVPYSGNQITKDDKTLAPSAGDGKPLRPAIGVAAGWTGNGHKYDDSGGDFFNDSYHQTVYSVGGLIPNPPPTKEATDGDYNDAWAQAQQSLAEQGAQQYGQIDITHLHGHSYIGNVGGQGVVGGDSSGDETTTTLDPPDPPWPLDIIETGSAWSGASNGQTESYSSLHFPKHTPILIKYTSQANLSVFGETLSSNFDRDGDTTPKANELGIHAFPPMYKGKPFYSKATGPVSAPDITTTTPYGTYPNQGQDTQQDIYTPWLHVSNGEHVLQGYYVKGKGHLYLDGSTTDYLTVLAKAIDCKPGDIVTMVMDVTLKKIKAVEDVKPPDYSGGLGPKPGVIAHD